MSRFLMTPLSALALLAATTASTSMQPASAQTTTQSTLTPLQGVPASPAPAPILAPSGETWTMPEIVVQPKWGANLQRTMHLLASSTPTRRNRVRILFYGQSITQPGWTDLILADLRRRFPHADIVSENRAIGGFASQLLVKSAEQDLYPFYPDLMILHIYGSHAEYEKIIEETRRRTTSEIVIQTDHVTDNDYKTEETDPAKLSPAQWGAWFNYSFLPSTATKFNAELVDVRSGWKTYLKSSNLEPKEFLSDNVHLNNRGNALMATMISPYLRYDPKLPVVDAKNVRTYTVGTDAKWAQGRLKLPFSGNRIDVIADANNGTKEGGKVRVLIDGKAPSQMMGTIAFTRTSIGHATWTPAITRLQSQAVLVPETWTAKITEISADGKKFKYSVRGSVTGDDGIGNSDETFVSKSKRVVIDPADWWLGFSSSPMPVGFEVTWKAVPQHVDVYNAPVTPDKAIEYSTTLAQGFANTSHTLELVALDKTPPRIKSIRVYEPPLK